MSYLELLEKFKSTKLDLLKINIACEVSEFSWNAELYPEVLKNDSFETICDFIHRIIRSSFNPEKISIFWLLIALNTALINYINLDTIKNDYEKAKSYTMQYYDIFNG